MPEHRTSRNRITAVIYLHKGGSVGGQRLLAKGRNTRKLLEFKYEFIPFKSDLEAYIAAKCPTYIAGRLMSEGR